MAKVIGWCGAMVQPLEQISPREETLIEAAHDLGVARAGLDGGAITGRVVLDLVKREQRDPT